MNKQKLESLLGLDFGKYEYYTDNLPYRYEVGSESTEYFSRDDLKWSPSNINIRAKYVTPLEFNIDEYDESQKDQFIDWVMEYIGRGKNESGK